MSETRKPFLIGAFLLGGLALLVAVLLLFNREGWSGRASHYVVYFTGALDGLNVGADVTYRGVKVGTVQDIRLSYDPRLKDVVMPVILRIDAVADAAADADGGHRGDLGQVIDRLVERGLRAQLQTQSLLTGQAVVALDFFPGSQGYVRTADDTELPAIPSVPSRVDQAAGLLRDLAASLRELPLREMVESANRTLQALERLSGSAALGDSLDDLAATAENVRLLSAQLQQQLPPILDNTRQGSARLDALLADATRTSAAARQTLEQLQVLAEETGGTLGPDSMLHYELLRTLEQLRRAGGALQRTAEELQQQPQSLIFGKPR